MARTLTMDDVDAGTTGGLLLSAGGSGRNQVAKNVALGRMALDYGDVMVHVFDTERRDYYDLEHLWNAAPAYRPAGVPSAT